MTDLFGSPLLPDAGVLPGLLFRLVLDLLVVTLLVRTYLRFIADRGHVFTYIVLNLVTFAVGFLLSKVPISLGFAVGLFGVFGILRYRTEALPARDLTYLFAFIGIALLNGLSHQGISLAELLIVNALIAVGIRVLETARFSRRELSRVVTYDRLELLAPDQNHALLADLRERTRLPITRCEIGDLDLLRDAAVVTIYYPPVSPPTALVRE